MVKNFYSETGVFIVLSDQILIRKSEKYSEIRQEINRDNGLSIKRTQWQSVLENCTELGKEIGMDFLVASYFAVASFKVEGIKGFASGLELIRNAYEQDCEHIGLSAHHKNEIVQWVISKTVAEVKLLNPSFSQVRELYRCEKAIQDLHGLCQCFQQEVIPKFESLAFAIFEHIDRIELAASNESRGRLRNEILINKSEKNWTWLVFVLWGASIMLTFYLTQSLNNGQFNNEISHSVPDIGDTSPNSAIVDFNALSMEQTQFFKEGLEKDLERFRMARSRAANIVDKLKSSDNSDEVNQLESYVLSLSPLYSRAIYIQDKIDENRLDKASKELMMLDTRLVRLQWLLSSYREKLTHHANGSTFGNSNKVIK